MFLVALLIFAAETSVVTLDTVRIIFVGRGFRLLSAVMGLVVVSIWLFAIRQIMDNLGSVQCFAAYALGYTLGVWLGMSIEERLAIGAQLVRIITSKDATPLVQRLRETDHGVTSIRANGATGPVHLIFTIVERRRQKLVIDLIRAFDPQTFYTVEDVRKQEAGVFPGRKRGAGASFGVPADALAGMAPIMREAA